LNLLGGSEESAEGEWRKPLDRSTGRGDNTGWRAGGRGDKEGSTENET